MPDTIKAPGGERPQHTEIVKALETSSETVPERGSVELKTESAPTSEKEKEQSTAATAIIPQTTAAQLPRTPKSPVRTEIEEILAEDLKELYMTLTPQQRTLFKLEGEKAAARIEEQLAKPRINIKEILHIIREWLKLLPGVNKFFIEKEVKIKTERILMIKEEGEE